MTDKPNPFAKDRWIGLAVSLMFIAIAVLAIATGHAPNGWDRQGSPEPGVNSLSFGAFMFCLGLCPMAFFAPSARSAFTWSGICVILAIVVVVLRS